MFLKPAFSKLLFLSVLLAATSAVYGQTTAFAYQGSLSSGGNAANGQYDFTFKLFDASTAGNQIGSAVSKTNISVTRGVFAVTLDFGASAFTGADRWVEISAKLSTDATFTTLTPRQQITATPYTIQSLNATTATNATQLGGVAANQYVLTGDARLSDARAASSINFNTATLGGVLPIANGGTGSPAQNFVDLSTNQANIGGNKTFTGTVSGTFSGDGSTLSNVPGTFRWLEARVSLQGQPNTGYLAANNAVQVTITLPALPTLGDTVRVSGLGAGGWKIAQNAGQSILGLNLNLYGVRWTARDSSRDWISVASSADGGKLVAVVSGTVSGQIYTSSDSGATWTARENNRFWNSVASSADGSKLVAVVRGGQIYTSTNSGATWTPRDIDRAWFSVTSSADGSKLVAVANGGQIYTSTDSGVTWTPRDSNRDWFSVASSADGSKLVAVEVGFQIYTSTDSGVTWTPRDSNRSWVSVASSADGSKLVAVVFGGQVYTSTDSGATWTPRDSNRLWRSVASSSDGNKLVALVQDGQIYTSNFTSATTTTQGTGGFLGGDQFSAIELQYVGSGQFLMISHEGTIVGF